MRITYDPTVDALSIRLIEERVECETILLTDQVAVDIGPGEREVNRNLKIQKQHFSSQYCIGVTPFFSAA